MDTKSDFWDMRPFRQKTKRQRLKRQALVNLAESVRSTSPVLESQMFSIHQTWSWLSFLFSHFFLFIWLTTIRVRGLMRDKTSRWRSTRDQLASSIVILPFSPKKLSCHSCPAFVQFSFILSHSPHSVHSEKPFCSSSWLFKELPWKGFTPYQGLSGTSIDLDTVRLDDYCCKTKY